MNTRAIVAVVLLIVATLLVYLFVWTGMKIPVRPASPIPAPSAIQEQTSATREGSRL